MKQKSRIKENLDKFDLNPEGFLHRSLTSFHMTICVTYCTRYVLFIQCPADV